MKQFPFETASSIPPADLVEKLVEYADFSHKEREQIVFQASAWVQQIRDKKEAGLMENFLAEYGLSTDEGIALMCLAEALLRVPDKETIDALIEDKIAPSDWGAHLGKSSSSLVNASTWALMFTGRVLEESPPGLVGNLRGAVKRLGEPVIRRAVTQAMREMGRQFVLGQDIHAALMRAKKREARGYCYSYDMLGEEAMTQADSDRYFHSYVNAISSIAQSAKFEDICENPGISVKLSALHPRYELLQENDVMENLVPRLFELAKLAKNARIGLNVDAEESERLSLSISVIEAVLQKDELAGWDGFGVVVQAYGKRAGGVIDYLYELAERFDRKIMVRLVKGAYWDREIKHAQQLGLDRFPVYTAKPATDISYIANARKLLSMTDRIYPQFATHNAHSISAILEMADDKSAFEFQRLHGMGDVLHDLVKEQAQTSCRIYAPVGAHRDLLAYLVRRLLENGANSSFVNQIVDVDIPAEDVVRDPFETIKEGYPDIKTGRELYAPERVNSRGFDIWDVEEINSIEEARVKFINKKWYAEPILATPQQGGEKVVIKNPADSNDQVGEVVFASEEDVKRAHKSAKAWDQPLVIRQAVLQKASDLFEENYAEIFALLTREAGKTIADAIAELREAVDFLRYYASQASNEISAQGRFICVSPWNFPLAIFTGQIAAALASGNAVLAKPAEQTPLIADFAIRLLHNAGVPVEALQLLPGRGPDVGEWLIQNEEVTGVCFTGSTKTAKIIRKNIAQNLKAGTPFIAETGGLNAMIVDSTALPEQVVRAIVESAFQSAGQRCSALRCLYVQNDIADRLIEMLIGSIREFRLGNPWSFNIDCGPVIDQPAQEMINCHIEKARNEGRLIYQSDAPLFGTFIAPTIIELKTIKDLEREIFGPVLHIVRFDVEKLDHVISEINETGYGLTFGLQTRIDDRVQKVVDKIEAGNIYVNRNQIGAIVGSQPFGGEAMSGTGPKAGGPNYLQRFMQSDRLNYNDAWGAEQNLEVLKSELNKKRQQVRISTQTLSGPTGESNRLSLYSRAPILCMGPSKKWAERQKQAVEKIGGFAVVLDGHLSPNALFELEGFSAAIWWGDENMAHQYELALANREGPILPLICGWPDIGYVCHERHVCVDTTASGGNAQLLASVSASA